MAGFWLVCRPFNGVFANSRRSYQQHKNQYAHAQLSFTALSRAHYAVSSRPVAQQLCFINFVRVRSHTRIAHVDDRSAALPGQTDQHRVSWRLCALCDAVAMIGVDVDAVGPVMRACPASRSAPLVGNKPSINQTMCVRRSVVIRARHQYNQEEVQLFVFEKDSIVNYRINNRLDRQK